MYFSQFGRLQVWGHKGTDMVFERASSFIDHLLLQCPHKAEGTRKLCGGPFKRAGIPFIEATPSWPMDLPKAPPSVPSHRALGFQHLNFGETHLHYSSYVNGNFRISWLIGIGKFFLLLLQLFSKLKIVSK